MPDSMTYGYILSSTPGSITRAVMLGDQVLIQTFKKTDEVGLTWEVFTALTAYVADSQPAQPPAAEPPPHEARPTSAPNGKRGLADGVFLAATDPELHRAWQTFADRNPQEVLPDERLQYMGTSIQEYGDWAHMFRSLKTPETGARQYWQIPADVGWAPSLPARR